MRPPPIPFLDLAAGTAELRRELDQAIGRVLDSGQFVLGPETEAFEGEFAAACGARAAIGVGTGLDAIAVALGALGVSAGDEVVVPSHTFIATWLAVRSLGAVPVPVEPRTPWSGLEAAAVSAAVTPRTTAIVTVDMHGHPADVGPLAAVARRHGLALVGDAAQAHGARWHGRPVGSLCDATAFSFYPAKNLGALGDGGAVVTDDPEVELRARRLRNYGGTGKYDHPVPGRNTRLDDLQSAVLRVKLNHLDDWNARRRARAERYLANLSPLTGGPDPTPRGSLEPPIVNACTVPSWHHFAVLVDHREEVRRNLSAAGIATGVHYPVPPHRSGAFADLGLGPGTLPVAERIADRILSLPIGPHLAPEAVDRVTDRLAALVGSA